MLNRLLTLYTHKIRSLPIVVLMPHSSCNCRCVMCDIWKANHNRREISVEQLQPLIAQFVRLRVREVVMSGGEALLHSNLWKLCSLLNAQRIKVTLLTTGLLLKKHAESVAEHVNNVIVSIDGPPEVHDKIRGIPNGYQKIADGIKAIHDIIPGYNITARSVFQRQNFRHFSETVSSAKSIGLNQISFLAADVSTTAFNRVDPVTDSHAATIVLSKDECVEAEGIIKDSFVKLRDEYASKFVNESPQKMERIIQYYKALHGMASFPKVVCNAPWVSTVIETDGSVQPCFFHKAVGNIFQDDLISVLNSTAAVKWRKTLNMDNDPVCSRCVCSLKLGVTQHR